MKTVMIINSKGGVGKTLNAINIAVELKKRGHSVGLFDADFDSSNFAEFVKLGEEDNIEIDEKDNIKLYDWNGIKVFSMSLMSGARAVSMEDNRYQQMIDDVLQYGDWDVDYIVVDAPAGTSSIFKAIVKLYADHFLGSIMICHPGTYDDSLRVINLHKFLEIPLLGAIENMAYFKCPGCGKKYNIFKKPYGKKLCKEFNVKYFGQIPLAQEITSDLEKGKIVLRDEFMTPILKAVNEIEQAKIVKPGFLKKVKIKINKDVANMVARLMFNFVNISNEMFDIDALRKKVGLTESAIFDIIITDNTKKIELFRGHFQLKNKLMIVRGKKITPKYELVMDLPTLARIVMGKKRLPNSGKLINYDYMDAYLSGEIVGYGSGHFPKSIKVIKALFTDEDILIPMRKKYGKLLMRFI